MAITHASPSSPLLLGLTGGLQTPNPAQPGAVMPAAPMQGGGFHFLFNGSLQAYQQARAESEAGKLLPPQGEALPEPAATDISVQPSELSAEQPQSALPRPTESDAAASDTDAQVSHALPGMEQPTGENLVAVESALPEPDPDAEVRQQAALNSESAAAAQALRSDQQQAVQGQRQDDQVQLQARETAHQQAHQQAELAAQQAAANAVDSQSIQQSAPNAGQQRAAEQRADAAAAQAARRQADAGAQHAATPAQPKPGAGEAAQPAVPAQPAAALSGLNMNGRPIVDNQVQDASLEPIQPVMQPLTAQPEGLSAGGDVVTVEQAVIAEESGDPVAVVPNPAAQNGQGMTPAAAAAAQSEAAAETALANMGTLRPGPDAASGRGPAEVISA